MKSSTKDQVEGRLQEMTSRATGQVTNSPRLTDKGHAEKLTGKVQERVGQVMKVFEK